MNKEEKIKEKLKEIKIEDYIWLVYVGIIFLSWYSNSLERKMYVETDMVSGKKYQSIMILIFSVLLIVYSYFFYGSWKDLKDLKPSDSDKDKLLVYLSFIASTLILISGIIFLYVAINNDNNDVELAFN